ncbi:MAG: hypothetical protein WBP13_01660 [Methylophilaceae bacterium]
MEKKPLYRKVNTLARNVHHHFGGDFRHEHNRKSETDFEVNRKSMHGRQRRGLDYTPLFKFLLSKIGSKWDVVYSEALSRIDKKEPIFWMVALYETDKQDIVRCGDNSYYSGLYVDDNGFLQMVNSKFSAREMTFSCICCTHTFNGERYGKAYV